MRERHWMIQQFVACGSSTQPLNSAWELLKNFLNCHRDDYCVISTILPRPPQRWCLLNKFSRSCIELTTKSNRNRSHDCNLHHRIQCSPCCWIFSLIFFQFSAALSAHKLIWQSSSWRCAKWRLPIETGEKSIRPVRLTLKPVFRSNLQSRINNRHHHIPDTYRVTSSCMPALKWFNFQASSKWK